MTPSSSMLQQPLPPATARKALTMAAWIKDKKGEDISILDLSGTSPVAEVMILVTAQGARHAKALADWLLKNLADSGQVYLGMEGYAEARWILVDCNDVLVHIFQDDSRRFYDLDGLWSRSPLLSPDAVPAAVSASDTTTSSAASSDTA